MRDVFEKFLIDGTPSGQRHFFNAHFPGLYSIVLAANGDLLTRAFVAQPGYLHRNLQLPDAPFLWHSHGYDFTETTIIGRVENYCIKVGSKRPFFEYEIHAGIDTGRKPTLSKVGKRLFDDVQHDVCAAGESFSLTYRVIHRVTFHPCPHTGWFACLVQETRKQTAPVTVFSEHLLTEVPDADELYVPVSNFEAGALVDQLLNCVSF